MKINYLNSNRLLFFYNKVALILLFNFNLLNGQSSDIDIIRDRVYHTILDNYSVFSSAESGFDDDAIKNILSDFDGNKWPYIHYENVSREVVGVGHGKFPDAPVYRRLIKKNAWIFADEIIFW